MHRAIWRVPTIPLGRVLPRASCDQPGAKRDAPSPCDAAVPIRSCSRWGLPCRPRCRRRGALLPPRFALARGVPYGALRGRFVFCGTFPEVAPAGGYPAPYSRGARTFPLPLARQRPSAVWRRERWLRSSLRVKRPAATDRWCGRAPLAGRQVHAGEDQRAARSCVPAAPATRPRGDYVAPSLRCACWTTIRGRAPGGRRVGPDRRRCPLRCCATGRPLGAAALSPSVERRLRGSHR